MISFWEKTALLKKDFIVIGGGLTGLLTAIELAFKFPEKDICVLERGILPIGATTRNAGFACFGSLSELYHDLLKEGETKVLELVEQRFRGLQKLLQITGKKAIQYEPFGGYELIDDKHIAAFQHIEEINQKLYTLFKKSVFQVVDNKITSYGFNQNVINHLVYNPLEGQLHSGYLMKRLQKIATQKGVTVLTGANVSKIENNQSTEQVIVTNETWRKPLIFEAEHVFVCNNAFASALCPELKVQPGRGQVLVTEPIYHLPFKGTFHYDEGFIYFRNLGNRILLGGARNQFLMSEATDRIETTSEVISYLQSFLHQVILNGESVAISDTWSGIMGFGETKLPIVQSIRPTLHVAIRFSGMGVALASHAAEQVVQLI